MTRPSRISREISNLIDALRRHLVLLSEYSHRAFDLGDQTFLGEVAGKLRVLVYRSQTSKPLLLDLMQHSGFTIPIIIDDPFGTFQVSLDEYMDMMACAIHVPSQGLVEITKSEFIAMWAQQYGASHEDWELDGRLVAILSLSDFLEVGGLPVAAAELRTTSRTVLWVGEELIRMVDALPKS
jgi:hypothetical protein